MKKIRNRSFFALILAAAMVFGLGTFVYRYWTMGEQWALMPANKAVFYQGVLDTGEVTDRNGLLLARAKDGVFSYAQDDLTREACLHATGDYGAYIGTGALSIFQKQLSGWDPVNGAVTFGDRGGSVKLSIDARLNRAAYQALAGRRGAVVVTNYETGEILCMVSCPSYDPQLGADLSDPNMEGVYINRALRAVYVPGSVFKTVTLAAAIENIPDLFERRFSCQGSENIGGDTVNCSGVHGDQNIEEAYANSCNCAFSRLAQELGGELLRQYALDLGLVEPFYVSGIETAEGRFDVAAADTGDLSWSAIGQHNDLTSPIAMARLSGAIANGGMAAEPVLLKGKDGGEIQLLSEETALRLSEMMNYNFALAYGGQPLPNTVLHGKTGTAEVGDGSSHGWFTGFVSEGKLPLAFAVVVENGGSGLKSAAPVALAVLKAALESGDL